jgi:hypothetical protein
MLFAAPGNGVLNRGTGFDTEIAALKQEQCWPSSTPTMLASHAFEQGRLLAFCGHGKSTALRTQRSLAWAARQGYCATV